MKRVGLSSVIALLIVLCSWTAASAFITPSAALLFLLASRDGPNDIVSLLPHEDYFKSRNVDVSVEKMMELAAKDPVDARTSIQQLLALRVLGEDPTRVKKAAGYAGNLKILQDIAAGKKAQDKLGFSKEYAAWAVARLTDQPAAQRAGAGKKLAESSLNWFPEDLNLVLALDFANGQNRLGQTKLVREAIEPFVKKIPQEAKMEIYKNVEELGNVRIDRIAVGVSEKGKKEFRFCWRFSGKGDHKALAESLAKIMKNEQIEKIKGPNNEAITIFPGGRFEPALAIVGDSDVVLGVLEKGDGKTVVTHMLDVRAGQKTSVLKGRLADHIKKVSDKADGLIVGNLLPSELVQEFGPPRGPFSSLPSPFLFEAARQKEGIDFRFQGKFAGKDAAKAFIDDSLKLRGQAMIQMKLAEKSPISFDGILKTLATLKMESKEDTASATMRLADEVIAAYMSAFAKLVNDRPGVK